MPTRTSAWPRRRVSWARPSARPPTPGARPSCVVDGAPHDAARVDDADSGAAAAVRHRPGGPGRLLRVRADDPPPAWLVVRPGTGRRTRAVRSGRPPGGLVRGHAAASAVPAR